MYCIKSALLNVPFTHMTITVWGTEMQPCRYRPFQNHRNQITNINVHLLEDYVICYRNATEFSSVESRSEGESRGVFLCRSFSIDHIRDRARRRGSTEPLSRPFGGGVWNRMHHRGSTIPSRRERKRGVGRTAQDGMC